MPDASSPNVVVVTTHDSGRHFGCYGVETIRSPAIDGLAEDGCLFSNCFTPSPQCSPSRAAMLTGRHPQNNGVIGLAADPWGWDLEDPEDHLSARLADAGYHTALFGVQHETRDVDRLAFETLDNEVRPGPEVAASAVDFFADAAEEDRPFYAQVGIFETHEPLDYEGTPPDDEQGVTVPPYVADTEDARELFAQLQGAVRRVDDAIATIREGLADAGVEKETLLVFTSDHGIPFPRAKGNLYDRGLEIPLVVRWPEGGVVGGARCDWLLSNVDFTPTVLDCCGLPIPADLDGESFRAAFENPDGDPLHHAVYASFTDHHAWNFGPEARCVRTDRYKLIRNFTADRLFDPPVELNPDAGSGARYGSKSGGGRPHVQLYDLREDPEEFENVAEDPDYAEVRADLDSRLWALLDATDDPVLSGAMAEPYHEQALADAPVPTGAEREE